MTAHLELGTLTTELVAVLGAQTGLMIGDGESPISGEPITSDYPYVVVYEINNLELYEILPAPSTTMITYQVTCVGLTRLQAARARDFCTVILDPTIAVATSTAKLLSRETVSTIMDIGDAGRLWSAVWRFQALATAV